MKPNKTISLIVVAVFATAAFHGCLDDTGGIAPPDDELVYPVALSTIKDDSHLLVVSSNSFLEYNAGTLVAYQLSHMDTFQGQPLGYDDDTGTFVLPPGVSLSEYCTGDITGAWCNLDVTQGIRADETIRFGAYASDLNITPNGDRALIPVRGDRAIIEVDILDGPNLLDCGEDAKGERRCADDHKISSNGSVSFPIEPHRVETMNYVHDGVVDTLGFATHRAGGEVSLFSVNRLQGGVNTPDNLLIKVIDGVIEGASGLAVNPHSQDILVVGQRDANPHVAVLDVRADLENEGSYLNNPSFSQDRTIGIYNEILSGKGARDIAVSPDGKTGFVVTQDPAAVIVLDLDRYEMVDMVTVCQQSSRVGTFVDAGDADDPLDDKLYAFVLCFVTGQVHILDPDLMYTVIRKTGAGPQDIAFDKKRQIAYISNFTDSTITMVQAVAPFNIIQVREADGAADPLILRIGKPKLPKGI